MQKPRALRKGSTIGIVAPASNVDREALLRGITALEESGYRVRYSDQVFMRDYYFAGAHDLRARELMRMFSDPQVDAIFCARGGYGCHHLLSLLDAEAIRTNPRLRAWAAPKPVVPRAAAATDMVFDQTQDRRVLTPEETAEVNEFLNRPDQDPTMRASVESAAADKQVELVEVYTEQLADTAAETAAAARGRGPKQHRRV